MDDYKVLELSTQCYKLSNNYVSLKQYVRDCGVSKPVDFNYVVSTLGNLKKEMASIISDANTINDDSELFSLLLDFSQVLNKALIMDYDINSKLLEKANGGKYGIFEYRKETKQLDALQDSLTDYWLRFSYTTEEAVKRYKRYKSVEGPAITITDIIVSLIKEEKVILCINKMESDKSVDSRNASLFSCLLYYSCGVLLRGRMNTALINEFLEKCGSEYGEKMNAPIKNSIDPSIVYSIMARGLCNSRERVVKSMENFIKNNIPFTAEESAVFNDVLDELEASIAEKYPTN